jgi:hypothetical protein
MGRTCRKASPHQMGAGKDYMGPLQRQGSTRWADYFSELVGPHWSKVTRGRNEWKVLENQLKGLNKLNYEQIQNHSRGLALRVSL